MARVFIFHGTGGHPGENWFPWLQDKLKEKGVETIIPQFPTPEGQSLEAWLEVLKEYETQIEEIKRRKRETKTFTKSKQGIIEYHVLGDILNKIKEEETELEMYLGSRGM